METLHLQSAPQKRRMFWRRLALVTGIMVSPLFVATAAPDVSQADTSDLPSAASAAANTAENPTQLKKADHIIVEKSSRSLSLYGAGDLLTRYQIALGGNPEGHKQREGDQRTPEGVYLITERNADSAFHLSLRISYPSLMDVSRARRQGRHPGGQIMIHGIGPNRPDLQAVHGMLDWTDGCIAVTDAEMEEIWALVDEGTMIDIRP